MKIIPSDYDISTELPLKLKISFEAVFDYLERIAKDKNHLLYSTANDMLEEYKKYPELREGFDDFSLLYTYQDQIDRLLDLIFPELLQSNEIKAASIPFEFTTFKLSKRFKEIMANAGEGYELKLKNYDHSKIFILSCTFILAFCYDNYLDFKRPFFYEIPDVRTGITKHYRTMFNGDFFKVRPLENAPKITEEDIHELLDNFNNIEIWKEKFPPNSYEFKGFGIVNLFDVSSDQSISKLKENLLRKDDEAFYELEKSISNLFGSNAIKFGFSTYDASTEGYSFKKYKNQNSFLTNNDDGSNCKGYFCEGIIHKVFEKQDLIAISDVDKYGIHTNNNNLFKVLKAQNIQSFILVPMRLNDQMMGILELVSPNKRELNSINAYKLEDVIPVFKVAIQRYMEEFENKLESVIQENYTAIHPTVKWKFYEQAQEFVFNEDNPNPEPIMLKDIIFEDVVPLYGQSDIKGSSMARNTAIQKDLVKQLNAAQKIIDKARIKYALPIYDDLIFRIKECQTNIKSGLDSGDEISLIDFLRSEIYPVFRHLNAIDPSFKTEIKKYMDRLDDKLGVIYDKRKDYENSVNKLNEHMAKFIDQKQVDAQHMFPHYFERYKTDGIDYNMYIGQSLVQNKLYDPLYLQNLRLWQLQMMCELENEVQNLKSELSHPLEVASLILVHSNPLSIKFRMDEKRFDVDGAYNIRYEIIKKRIDKALIKNTKERLTQPGKIAIVYSQNKDAAEYLKYIRFMQSHGCLHKEVEDLDIQDLQGISGLKALRVSVNFERDDKNTMTIDEIMDVIKDENLN